MKDQVYKNWYMLLIKGIIMVALALFILVNPEGTLKAVALYIGIGFLITGVLLFIRHTPSNSSGGRWNINTAEAVADITIGILLIIAPRLMIALIPFLIGIWAAYYGGLIIIDSFRAATDGALRFVSGIVIVLLAMILVFNPLFLGFTLLIWMGILLLVYGGFNIYLSVRMNQLRKVN